mmetsp:Transcript_10819/g.28244  ORF Transcript_10819/g.28244 Transcript_10819/m.28244 type:complete len:215 (-) Transcript_10819:372-1016(-)
MEPQNFSRAPPGETKLYSSRPCPSMNFAKCSPLLRNTWISGRQVRHCARGSPCAVCSTRRSAATGLGLVPGPPVPPWKPLPKGTSREPDGELPRRRCTATRSATSPLMSVMSTAPDSGFRGRAGMTRMHSQVPGTTSSGHNSCSSSPGKPGTAASWDSTECRATAGFPVEAAPCSARAGACCRGPPCLEGSAARGLGRKDIAEGRPDGPRSCME